jgi:hypothetical protein
LRHANAGVAFAADRVVEEAMGERRWCEERVSKKSGASRVRPDFAATASSQEKRFASTNTAVATLRPYDEGMRPIIPRVYWCSSEAVGRAAVRYAGVFGL